MSKSLNSSRYECILIATSMGGPQAMHKFMPLLMAKTRIPILIVQHMMPVMTTTFARGLTQSCQDNGGIVCEAKDKMLLAPHTAIVAPGDYHMHVTPSPQGKMVRLDNKTGKVQGCRPAADVLFQSAASTFGSRCLAVILTGMGRDGTTGAAYLKAAGATVLAQDKETSAVWGMPGSAVNAGLVDQVHPLLKLPSVVAKFVN